MPVWHSNNIIVRFQQPQIRIKVHSFLRNNMAFKAAQALALLLVGSCFADRAVTPAPDDDAIRHAIDCTEFRRNAPADAIWIPTCDPETNQLTPHQVATDGLEFCVDTSSGVNLFGPQNHTISCECVTKAYQTLLKDRKAEYIPQCSLKSGLYLPKQCDATGACWCVDKNGSQLGPRWNSKSRIASTNPNDRVHAPIIGAPKLSCETIRKFWESIPVDPKKPLFA